MSLPHALSRSVLTGLNRYRWRRPCLLLVVVSTVLWGCDSEKALDKLIPPPAPVQLPAATARGANTLGMLLNGAVWEASSHGSIRPLVLPSPDASYLRGRLWLSAAKRTQVTGPVVGLTISVSALRSPGIYLLSYPRYQRPRSPGASYEAYAEMASSDVRVRYGTDTLRTGTLTVTHLDTVSARKFIAGRFELQARPVGGVAPPPDQPSQLILTQGRFDVELNRP